MPGPGAPTPTLPGQVGTGGLLTEAMKKGVLFLFITPLE